MWSFAWCKMSSTFTSQCIKITTKIQNRDNVLQPALPEISGVFGPVWYVHIYVRSTASYDLVGLAHQHRGINIVLYKLSYKCDQCTHIFRPRKSAYLTANTSIRNFGNVYPIIIDFLFQLLTPDSRSNIKI